MVRVVTWIIERLLKRIETEESIKLTQDLCLKNNGIRTLMHILKW